MHSRPSGMWRSLTLFAFLVAGANCQDMVTTIPPEEAATATQSSEKTHVMPTIRSLQINSDIKYRYATTLISTKVVNPANQSGEATFTVTLPESAFISQFLMVIKDKVYKAYVKEKEQAKAIYQEAVLAGHFAGHVALDARDSNQFTVSVNIEAHGKVTFNLTYEQLLVRNLGVYSNVININPHQIVEDMSVKVNIEEPSAIINLEVPELQVSNEVISEKTNEEAKIEEISPNHKQVTWAPTPDQQRSINSTGLSGQFIVKYDVDRKENPQQILVDEGYFVHFFAPEDLPILRKHVIFVLDFSGSMSGRKLEQLKEAMQQIFSELSPKDYFSIVIFHSWVEVWSPSSTYMAVQSEYISPWETEMIEKRNRSQTLSSQFVLEANPTNIELARSFMGNYSDLGSTNIMGGLRTGLQLVDIGEELWANESNPPQPLVVFLTDGQPNVEEYNTDTIISKTKALNTKQSPIFSLAFGYGAEFNFLRKLSLQNSGFARNIYEAADASRQLKNFYKTISSPVFSNVTFNYLPGQVDNSSNTKQVFPVFFRGSELVVAGRVNQESVAADKTIGELRGTSASGLEVYPIVIPHNLTFRPHNRSVGHLEKAWSYLTIQQLLDKADSLDDGKEKNQTKKQALDIALKYAFVTPLTSLVVVKPNETESSVDATKIKPGADSHAFGYGGGFPGARPAAPSLMAYPLPVSSSAGGFQQSLHSQHSYMMAGGSGNGGRRLVGAMRPLRKNSYLRPVSLRTQTSSVHVPPSTPINIGLPPPSSPPRWTESLADLQTVPSTPYSDSTSTESNEPPKPQKVPLEHISWAQQALNATNKSIPLEGTNYKLGINETNSAFGDCQVNNNSGECHHLQYCALDVFKNDISQFLPYKCDIPGLFLGVCCPKELV